MWDRDTNTTTRINLNSVDAQANGSSYTPAISADGRYVTYESEATNLVAGDTNGLPDIFVFDRDTNTTTRVSVDSAGNQANNLSDKPSLSADGRYVTYQGAANNLVAGDTNAAWDIFVWDRDTNTTTRVGVDSAGTEANGSSYSPSISADGRFVSYDSVSSNLVAGDTNSNQDVFVSEVTSTAPIAGVDFGDAPDTYKSLVASSGAAHANTGPQLGFLRDTEADGQPSASAVADSADEDGVTFSTFVAGQLANVTIEMFGGPAYIDAWFDFNADGDWDDAGEQIFTSFAVAAGINQISVAIPETATIDDTYARFRLSTEGGLDSSGFARDGEVEDYLVTITQTLEVNLPSGNGADDVSISLNGGNVVVYDINGSSVIASSPLAFTHSVVINGAVAEDNTVVVDYQIGGFFSLLGGILF
ncbi:MAG: TolB family protein, partial [Pirellulales bacterium]